MDLLIRLFIRFTKAAGFTLAAFVLSCKTITVSEPQIFAPYRIAAFEQHNSYEETCIKTQNGNTLNCLLFPNQSDKLIIYFHGNIGCIWDYDNFHACKRLQSQGYNVFSVDYQGYGKSTGTATLANLKSDATDAYKYISTEFIGKPVVVYGFSLGTIAALQLGASQTVNGIILESTISNPQKMAKYFKSKIKAPTKYFVRIKVSQSMSNQMNVDSLAALLNCPVLMMHGKLDGTAPEALAKELFGRMTTNNKKYIEFTRADHNGLCKTDSLLYWSSINTFLNR